MGKKHKLSSKPYTALKKEKKLLGRATTGPCFLIENLKLTVCCYHSLQHPLHPVQVFSSLP